MNRSVIDAAPSVGHSRERSARVHPVIVVPTKRSWLLGNERVRVVASGEALLAPSVTRRLITEFSKLSDAPRAPALTRIGDLTERETEVLVLIAQGLSNGEIAGHLVVAESTIKTHVSRILVKLGLRDRTQAAVFAYEARLVTPA